MPGHRRIAWVSVLSLYAPAAFAHEPAPGTKIGTSRVLIGPCVSGECEVIPAIEIGGRRYELRGPGHAAEWISTYPGTTVAVQGSVRRVAGRDVFVMTSEEVGLYGEIGTVPVRLGDADRIHLPVLKLPRDRVIVLQGPERIGLLHHAHETGPVWVRGTMSPRDDGLGSVFRVNGLRAESAPGGMLAVGSNVGREQNTRSGGRQPSVGPSSLLGGGAPR